MFSITRSNFSWQKISKLTVVTALAIVTLSFNGCILDAFDTLTQEIPYSVEVSVSGSANEVEQSTTVNLDDNDFYNNNRDNINRIELLKVAYKTNSVSPESLTGNIILTVKQSNGIVLFSKVIPGNRPADYLVNPYELTLTQAEIQLVNAYLSILTNRVFTATVTISTSTQGNKTIDAQVYAVFDMEYDL